MKKSLVFLAVFMFIFGTNVFSQGSTGWDTWSFKNYTIDYPTDNLSNKNLQKGTFTIFFTYKDKIDMEINDLAGYGLTLDTYSSQYFDNYFRLTNVTVTQNKRIIINNQPCKKIVAAVDDGHGEVKFKTMVYIWVKNNWAYDLRFVAAPSKFDELQPIAEQIAASFKFTK